MTGATITTVIGTRAEAVRVAPVLLAARRRGEPQLTVVLTGEQRAPVDEVLTHFGIRADLDLDLAGRCRSRGQLLAATIDELDTLFGNDAPDAVMVHGDTVAATAAALAAFHRRTPVVHLEAGLRGPDRLVPFPEEVNRRMLGALAELHLVPTARARKNLLREGVPAERITITGGTGTDALLWTMSRPAPPEPPLLSELDVDLRRVVLLAVRRAESWQDPGGGLAAAVTFLATQRPDIRFILPLRPAGPPGPALRARLAELPNLTCCPEPAYPVFLRLLGRAYIVLTDSGSVQEEAPGLGRPVLVLRSATERPEATWLGTTRLVGTDAEQIVKEVRWLLDDQGQHARMAHPARPYGDGRAACRVLEAIDHLLGRADQRPVDFNPMGVLGF